MTSYLIVVLFMTPVSLLIISEKKHIPMKIQDRFRIISFLVTGVTSPNTTVVSVVTVQ